ncbi:MAG: hypothetical protein JWQ69_3744 [Pseudomonas sp.]|nr:hypothetical protein [Pseudomonas sp.]
MPPPPLVGARLPAIQCEALAKVVKSNLQEGPAALFAGMRAPTGDCAVHKIQRRLPVILLKHINYYSDASS